MSRNDAILLTKANLQLGQRVRLLEWAILITQTSETLHTVAGALKEAGTTYHNLTIGQSGHKFGPPGPFLVVRAAIATHFAATVESQKKTFNDFVENFCTPTPFWATSPAALQHYETETPKGYTMDKIVAKLNDKAA